MPSPAVLRRTRPAVIALVLAVAAGVAAIVATDVAIRSIGTLSLLVVLVALTHRWLLSWRILLAVTTLVVFFVPIKRYGFPGALPIDIEPYRLIIVFLILGWVLALLADPRVRLRRTGLEGPIALFAAAAVASVLVNADRVELFGLEADVIKTLSFFASFLLICYLVVSVVRTWDEIDVLVKTLVVSGSVVASFAVVEFHTGFNVFDHLAEAVPLLRYQPPPDILGDSLTRSGRLRVFASAQHPLALSAILVMLVPFAVYLARVTGRMRWWLAGALLLLGALTTISRTGALMLIVVLLVFLWLRPAETRRLWPALPLLLVVVYLALPNALGSLYGSFFPEGGLISEQSVVVENNDLANGRLADVGPTLDEVGRQPLLGEGFGTRIVDPARANAPILDNQWLLLLAETGIAGTVAMLWLFAGSLRRSVRWAKNDRSPRGWLFVATAASISSFALGMFSFDAFSFIQVTLALFVVLGVAAAGMHAVGDVSRAGPVRIGQAVHAKAPGRPS